MKPLDPRLLRYAKAVRKVLGIGALLGFVRTIAIIVWCYALGQGITILALPMLQGAGPDAGRVAEGAFSASALPQVVTVAFAAVCVRAAASWGIDVLAQRGAVRAKSQLRGQVLRELNGGRRQELAQSDAELATLLGRGLDALDGYFAQYLPQFILTVVATPFLVLAVLLSDVVSGITVILVFPVIPVFMILIGMATQAVQDRQWRQLERLSASFLDVVTGLSTLKIFGRERRQIARIGRESDEYRVRTGKVLRVTFLSGFVLDLAGTFSIALVAVTVGTRIVNGEFPLATGLFVLLLLPEVFVPIRQVGAAYHASTEGLTAVQRVFVVLEQLRGGDTGGDAGTAAATQDAKAAATLGVSAGNAATGEALISVRDVVLARSGVELTEAVSFAVQPGEILALAGPSGVGKSTLLAVLRGRVQAATGCAQLHGEYAWVGQQPGLLQGSILENVTLGDAEPSVELAAAQMQAVGLGELALEKPLGPAGEGVSGGQAQRIAIARALYRAKKRGSRILLLDEPTSALDGQSEETVARVLRERAAAGCAVLVVTHRPRLLAAADRVVQLKGVRA